MYQDGDALSEIITELASTTGEAIALASLHRYCLRVVKVEKERRAKIKARAQAMIELGRENPDCTDAQITQALVYQALLENQNSLHELDLGKLLALQTRREADKGHREIEQAKLALEHQKLEHERAILNFKERVSVQATTAADEVQRVVKSNGLSDAAALEIRQKILGVAS